MDQRLRPKERLRDPGEFRRVLAARYSASQAGFAIYVARNGLAWSRIGISVAKRYGVAVKRNRVKRRVREAFRKNKTRFPPGLDLVVLVRSATADAERTLDELLVKLILAAAGRLVMAEAARKAESARCGAATLPESRPDGERQ
jgi:ribonuclease P protein component